MARSVADLLEDARNREEPGFNDPSGPAPGGVDPLGLRQINFDLMDQVFPGVNNVARHIRPFVVVTWAWHRAAQLAVRDGLRPVPTSLLRDFVDRVEVIYAWSQFLRAPNSDLPGRDVLAPLIAAPSYTFAGPDWEKRRDARRYSTAFSAPINYGPALRAVGWLVPAEDGSGALQASIIATRAIEALEAEIAVHLAHPALSQLGAAEVASADVRAWGDAWRLDRPTEAEKLAAAQLLGGASANPRRAAGVALAIAAAEALGSQDTQAIRRAMSGSPSNFMSPTELAATQAMWRKVQVRQVLRLGLEALFAWAVDRIGAAPLPTSALVQAFLAAPGVPSATTTTTWLDDSQPDMGPVEHLKALEVALQPQDRAGVPAAVVAALAFCIAEAPAGPEGSEAPERLPLTLVARQAASFVDEPPAAFLKHVFEAWLFGQHTYWSVGRGLADARGNGKALLRLRVAMEEGGWTRTPGAQSTTPLATADRLATIIAVATEAGLVASENGA